MVPVTRMQKAGHIYYVICRGNGPRPLFSSKEDHQEYLSYLNQARKQFPVDIYNYVLMPHHIHLLVGPQEEGALSKFMEWVSKRYAKYFNKKYNTIGHVFLRRYKSFVIQEEKYFLACCRYIDLKPLAEKIVKDPAEYAWSGFNQLAHGEEGPFKLDHHRGYDDLGKNNSERKFLYNALVVQGHLQDLDVVNFRGHAIGDKEFRKKIRDVKGGK